MKVHFLTNESSINNTSKNLNLAIAADIGGSHISCVAIDMDHNELIDKTLTDSAVNSSGNIAEIIKTWSDAISRTISLSQSYGTPEGIGIAMPGPFDYLNGVSLLDGSNGKYGSTFHSNIRTLLNHELQTNIPIRFINDASAYAIGEDISGRSKEFDKSIALTMGTGLGSAFIDNELPVVKDPRVPEYGCLWHLPFEEGNVDDYFSTRGLLKRYKSLSGKKPESVKVIAQSTKDDPVAKAVMEDLGLKLAMCLAPWMDRFNPDGIVIGGNISRAFEYFGPVLVSHLNQSGIECRVITTRLFEKAALLGAARLVDSDYYDRIRPILAEMK